MVLDVASITSTLRPRRVVGAFAAVAVCAAVGTMLVTGPTVNPAERLERARDLVFQHEPEAALREVRRALAELGPEDDPGMRLKALARAAQISDFHLGPGRVSEAIGYYQDLVREFPSSPQAFDAGVRIAEILRQRHDEKPAEEQFVAVVDAFPKQAGVERLLLKAARIAVDGRRYEAARTYVTRILGTYGDSEITSEAQHLLGTSLHLEGRHGDAVAAFTAVAERWPNTERAGRALHDAGNCLAEQGDLGLAMARYIEALADHPDPIAVQKSLERVRRRYAVERDLKTGSKAVAFGHGNPHPLAR